MTGRAGMRFTDLLFGRGDLGLIEALSRQL
jgi:hypothetical protein